MSPPSPPPPPSPQVLVGSRLQSAGQLLAAATGSVVPVVRAEWPCGIWGPGHHGRVGAPPMLGKVQAQHTPTHHTWPKHYLTVTAVWGKCLTVTVQCPLQHRVHAHACIILTSDRPSHLRRRPGSCRHCGTPDAAVMGKAERRVALPSLATVNLSSSSESRQ
ncbi:hypothetical protein O3P69_002321 [Scylla paramamosain]|uniref:Uncharacterized protein n=1 Tax=Scylla paramamosain TaxID=85552 RepID=A0AAW0V5S6_SCYPA